MLNNIVQLKYNLNYILQEYGCAVYYSPKFYRFSLVIEGKFSVRDAQQHSTVKFNLNYSESFPRKWLCRPKFYQFSFAIGGK